jgi:hypothetical protein
MKLWVSKQPEKTLPYRVYCNGFTVGLKTKDEALRVKAFIERIMK